MSVIVPARNAGQSIRRTLAALCSQDFGGDYEVIVVDDASSDDTAGVAAAGGAAVVRLRENRGAAVARNAGAAVARAPVLAFTDADCEPAPGWLRAGLTCLEHADLVQGAIEPPAGALARPFDHTLWVSRESGLYESANLFVRREAFDRVAGFWPFLKGEAGPTADADLPGMLPRRTGRRPGRPFGEDAWFGWRARRAGARTAFCAGALVRHDVVPRSPADLIAEAARRRFFPALTRQVPELRQHFYYRRWFLSRRSAAFDLALVSAAGAVALRRPALLLGALPYLAAVVPPGSGWRRARPWLWQLAAVPADGVGFVALVAGSAAARTVVL